MMCEDETLVAELTPQGRGAVAVVLVAGNLAAKIVDQCFRPASGRPLQDAAINQIRLGRWGHAHGQDAAVEEVIACRRAQDRVEIHCHGGAAAVRAVADRLVACGCRRINWQEWITANERDPIRSAARIALADAPTSRTAAILLDQYNGALTEEILSTQRAIAAAQWTDAAQLLDGVLASCDIGQHLTTAWRVVLAGPPNVGKSSLLNALAGFQRAIVSPLPGTTRDIVTLSTAIDGWPVTLTDTAGLHLPGNELEAAGIDLAIAAIGDADLVLVVVDVNTPHTGADVSFGSPLEENYPSRSILVFNKIDLLPAEGIETLRSSADGQPVPARFTSATTNEGIPSLIAAIGQLLVPSPPAAGTAVPFARSQVNALSLARDAINRKEASAASAALQSLLAN